MNLKTATAINYLLRWILRLPIQTAEGKRLVSEAQAKAAAQRLAEAGRKSGQGVPGPEYVDEAWPAEGGGGAAAARYERGLRAIAACPLLGEDLREWTQEQIEHLLNGLEAECWSCGTFVHDGPCVSDQGEDGR